MKTSTRANRKPKRFVVHICKDGTISYRDRVKKEKVFNGAALPVCSVDTEEEAEALQTRFGRLAYTEHPKMPGRPWYKLSTLPDGRPLTRVLEISDLFQIGEMFRGFNRNAATL